MLNVGIVGTFASRCVTVRAFTWSGRGTEGLKPSGRRGRTLIADALVPVRKGPPWVREEPSEPGIKR